MSCDDVREFLIDLGLDEAARHRAAEALAHVEACAECRAAFHDYDRIASTLHQAAELSPEEAEWARSTGQAESWAAVEGRIEAASEADGNKSPRGYRILKACAAVAAALLLAAAGFLAGRGGAKSSAMGRGEVAGAVSPGPTPAEVALQVKTFREINADFDGRLPWIVLARGEPDVGHADPVRLRQGSEAEPRGQRLIVVRLKLLRGREVVSDADLVIVAGQTAELSVPTTLGPSLRYRVATSANAPDRVALHAEMRAADDHEAEAALATDLRLRPDRATTAGQLVTAGGSYDLAVSYGTPL